MAERMMFIDTSKCMACKACQVACKQWHSLPAEVTEFTGSYQNPPGFSDNTLTYVKFKEHEDAGKLQWLFFKNQCKHCIRPKCQQRNPKGVLRTSGIVLYTEFCTWQNVRLMTTAEITEYNALDEEGKKAYKIELFVASCPFRVPRWSDGANRFVKCDFCYDRFNGVNPITYRDGLPTTACELTCPPGAIKTGTVAEITALANARYAKVKLTYPKACLYNGGFGKTSVLFLLTAYPSSYGAEPLAQAL